MSNEIEEVQYEVDIEPDGDSGMFKVTMPVFEVFDSEGGPIMGFRTTPEGLIDLGVHFISTGKEIMSEWIGELCSEDEDD
jgi:hypothetical protein